VGVDIRSVKLKKALKSMFMKYFRGDLLEKYLESSDKLWTIPMRSRIINLIGVK